MTWSVEPVSNTVQRMRISYRQNADWTFKMLLSTDRHLDSTHTDLKLQRKHLEQAAANNWPVIDLGDTMDAMQGRKDPRSCRADLLPYLHSKEEYYDAVVEFAHKFYKPYRDQLAMITVGNHETSILRHNETNLTKRLVTRLQDDGSPVVMGPYSGWLRLQFEMEGCKGGRTSVNIRHTHGGGGSAPVTKGVIKTNRRAVVFPDANIVISGHTHEAFCMPLARERISTTGRVYKDDQLHIQIPSYKDETTGATHGWALEKEFPPKPIGAYWLIFTYDADARCLRYDATRAL